MVAGAGAPPAAGRTTVQVVRVEEAHADVLAEFLRQTWSPGATAESVRAARAEQARTNPLGAGEEIPTFLLVSEGRALGHVTTIPLRLWCDGREHRAHWVKGLWVLPEHRNGPVGFLVLKEAARQLGWALGMVVQEAPRRLFQALRFSDLGAMSNHVRLLDAPAVLSRIDVAGVGLSRGPTWLPRAARMAQRSGAAWAGGHLVAGATRAWTLALGRAGGGLRVAPEPNPDWSEMTALWERARVRIAAGAVRDGATLHWRYGLREPGLYTLVVARRRGELVGLAVVRRPGETDDPRLAGVRVAVLSDVLFVPGDERAGLAALAGAEEVARDLGAQALVSGASHAALRALLPRRGYVALPGTVHCVVRAGSAADALPATLPVAVAMRDWWLTRGDSDADEAF